MNDSIEVELVYAEPERNWRQTLHLPLGATVADALALWDATQFPPHCNPEASALAVFGQKAKPSDALYANDRIEILRPLTRDPKDTRRLRAAANPLKTPKR